MASESAVRRESPSFPSSISHHAGHWCYGSCRPGDAGSGRDGSLAAEVLGGDICLPPNASMPLHDHPNIVVLVTLLGIPWYLYRYLPTCFKGSPTTRDSAIGSPTTHDSTIGSPTTRDLAIGSPTTRDTSRVVSSGR